MNSKFVLAATVVILLLLPFQNCSVYTSEGRKLLDEQGLDIGENQSNNTNDTSNSESSGSTTEQGANSVIGKLVYEQIASSGKTCAGCHGTDGAGFGPDCGGLNCRSLTTTSSAITKLFVRGGAVASGMPEFSPTLVTDQQLEDLLAYIDTL